MVGRKVMVRKTSFLRLALATAVAASAIGAQAITFSNVTIVSSPLSDGASFMTNANSISFFTPNALVGDAVDPLRSGVLQIQFDASNFGGPEMLANEISVNLAGVTLGSGTIFFVETIFEIDENGNEIGTPLGSITHQFDVNSSPIWSDTIVFSRTVEAIRVKKSFVLSAADTDVEDLAAVAIVNQAIHVVPEPATMGALGMGAVALLARRRRK